MSITLINSPIDYSPAYAQLVYTVDSNLITESGFRYICEVWLGATKLGTLKSVPHPIHGWGRFDISGLVQTTLELEMSFDTVVFGSAQGWATVQASFGWEYTTSGGTYVKELNQISDSKIYFNAAPTFDEFSSLQTGTHPYVITGVPTGRYPLTTRRIVETHNDTRQWLFWLNTDHNNVRYMQFRDDITGEEEIFIQLPAPIQDNVNGKLVGYRVDPQTVEDETVYANRLINWSVRAIDNAANPTSEWISYRSLPCTRWDLYSIYYLNRWGGIDSFSFNGRVQEQQTANKETYKRAHPRINTDGTVDWDGQLHSTRTYFSQYNTRYKLNSGWIDESQQETLKDLLSSPLVWMEDNTKVSPVTVLDNNINIQRRQDGVISATINVEKQETNKRQSA